MFSCPDGKDSGLHFHNTTDNSFVGRIAYDHNSTGDNMLFTVGSVEAMRIESGGNVGIGTTNPANKLDVRGVGTVARFVSSNAYVDQIMVNSGATNFLNFSGSTFNLYNNGGSASNVTLSITPTDATFTGNVTVEGALTETSARRFKDNIKIFRGADGIHCDYCRRGKRSIPRSSIRERRKNTRCTVYEINCCISKSYSRSTKTNWRVEKGDIYIKEKIR